MHLLQIGKTFPVIRISCFAIEYFHSIVGYQNPWLSSLPYNVLEGVKRLLAYSATIYINRIRWIEPNDLALSLFLIKNIIGGVFRCIYQVFFESTFFLKHQCKVVFLFQIFLYCTRIRITFFWWIWAIPVLCLVRGLNLYWCRQGGYPVSV